MLQAGTFARPRSIVVHLLHIAHKEGGIQMLSYRTVEPHTLELLKKLMAAKCLSGTRLVGGTGLTLQYGHRMSVDIDLFGEMEDNDEAIKDVLRQAGQLTILKESKDIKIYVIDRIKLDIIHYAYPWIAPCIEEDGIRLASPKDIASMKINAIEGRGTKKDFIDMYSLLQHYTLEEILKFYQQKYPEHSIVRALMSLSYFEDADTQLMPKMFIQTTWEEMKADIQKQVEAYSR